MAVLGTVVAISGTTTANPVVVVVDEKGNKKPLHMGDTVQPGETIITPAGVVVELQLANGNNLQIVAEQTVKLTQELADASAPDAGDSAVNQATIDSVIAAVNEGKDIGDVLDPTAAGLDGAGASEGSSFVNLLRIVEGVTPLAFQFDRGAQDGFRTEHEVAVPVVVAANNTLPSAAISINTIAGNDIVNAAEASGNISISGHVMGDAKMNDTVTLTIGNNIYTGLVDANNNYSISVPGSVLAINNSVSASITATDNNGNSVTANSSHGYTVDVLASAAISINTIAGNDIVNAAEASGNISISGHVMGDAKMNDTVTLTIGNNIYTGLVDANNNYSISVPGSVLAINNSVSASITATDNNGNSVTANSSHGYTVDVLASAAISINTIAGNDIVNAAEASGNISISGHVMGDAKMNDTVTLTIGNNIYTGLVDANNNYSISVPGSVLAINNSVSASITATDNNGNSVTANSSHGYTVDVLASAAISINTIAGNDIVNAAEASGNISISGHVMGDAKMNDTVTLTIGNNIYTGLVDANNNYSISVPGSVLAINNSVSASITATDNNGNSVTANSSHGYTVDVLASAAISINTIAGNDIVNAAEASGNISISGHVMGDAKMNDTVTLTIGNNIYTGLVDANNNYSISVPGSVLAINNSVSASITATDNNGNSVTANSSHGYTVDVIAPNAMTSASFDIGLTANYYGLNDSVITKMGTNLLSNVLNDIKTNTATATFTANELNFGVNNGSVISNNLGTTGNLQNWLSGNATNLNLASSYGTTKQAIVELTGAINLAAGTYGLQIKGDDGYQITIDGNVVASEPLNQAPTTTNYSFTLAQSGVHTIDIVYWDQGGQAVFQASLLSPGSSSYQVMDLNTLGMANFTLGLPSTNVAVGDVVTVVDTSLSALGVSSTTSASHTVVQGDISAGSVTFQEAPPLAGGVSTYVANITDKNGNVSSALTETVFSSGNHAVADGVGADVFKWTLDANQTAGSPSVDTISNFNVAPSNAGGSVLDFRDLLQGEHSATSAFNLTNYVHFQLQGSDTVINVSETGAFTASNTSASKDTAQIVLSGVDLTSAGSLTDAQILHNLLNSGKLITDH